MADPRQCDVCGKSYTPSRSDSKYCSHACREKARRLRNRPRYVPVWSAPVERGEVVHTPKDAEAAVLAAHRAANDLGRLSRSGPYQLRAAFARISEAIQSALDAEGF